MIKSKRIGIVCLALITALSMSACSGKSTGKSSGSDSTAASSTDSAESILKEAFENYKNAEKKAVETKSVTSYSDGTEETEYYTTIWDTKDKTIEKTSTDDDDLVYEAYYIGKDNGYGAYVKDELTNDEWKYYEESTNDEDENEYAYCQQDFDLEYTEEDGYSNLEYSNEGEEEIDGVNTIKLKVKANQVYSSGEESVEEITRESVMKEYEWNEEDVALVDGFSDILDNYVTASKASEEETTVDCVLTVWVNSEDHTIVKTRSATDLTSALSEENTEAINTFNENYWKVSLIHQNLEDGMSKDEAKAALEEDLESIDSTDSEESTNEASGETYDEEDGSDDYAQTTKTAVTKKVMTGDACPDMDDLPKDYEKITKDEYYNGDLEVTDGEDDFFGDESEYEDEFE